MKKDKLAALKRMGHSQTEIAKELEVHKSTISRKLRRNVGERGYRPKQTNQKTVERRVKFYVQEAYFGRDLERGGRESAPRLETRTNFGMVENIRS